MKKGSYIMNKASKFFDFSETSHDSKPSVITPSIDDNNLLLNVIDMVCNIGKGYTTDVVGNFADNNGTVFEKEMERCLNHYKFEQILVTNTGVQQANKITEIKMTTTELIHILKNPTELSLWDDLLVRCQNAFGDRSIYISQPAGNNKEPDFLVYYDNRIFLIENKKMNRSNKPSYGDNGCHPNVIYMIKRCHGTKAQGGGVQHTYYLGSDLITAEQYEAGMMQRVEAKKFIREYLKKFSLVNGDTRLGCNAKDLETVLGHEDQTTFENNVREYIIKE